jgi:[ribosomal protein S18]-alanine N-acetyltransferase
VIPDGLVVGALTTADAERCAELEAILFPGDDPWSAQAFREELRTGHRYLAARDGEARLVGYGGVALLPGRLGQQAELEGPAPLRSVSEAEIHTIGVDPAWQGRGVGRVLLDGLLAAADRIDATTYLEVRADNEPAQRLYRATGFEVVGTRRRYYASGADAYTMRRAPAPR